MFSFKAGSKPTGINNADDPLYYYPDAPRSPYNKNKQEKKDKILQPKTRASGARDNKFESPPPKSSNNTIDVNA